MIEMPPSEDLLINSLARSPITISIQAMYGCLQSFYHFSDGIASLSDLVNCFDFEFICGKRPVTASC